MALICTVQPALPITLALAKEHCRISGTAEDATLTAYIKAGVQYLLNKRKLVLGTATYTYTFDTLDYEIQLPIVPVQSITSIQYTSADISSYSVLPNTRYYLHNANNPHSPATIIIPNITLPTGTTVTTRREAFKVTFVAGYATVPDDLQAAMLLYSAERFENREGTEEKETYRAFDNIVAHYGITTIGQ